VGLQLQRGLGLDPGGFTMTPVWVQGWGQGEGGGGTGRGGQGCGETQCVVTPGVPRFAKGRGWLAGGLPSAYLRGQGCCSRDRSTGTGTGTGRVQGQEQGQGEG